jgi:hypothetical protein
MENEPEGIKKIYEAINKKIRSGLQHGFFSYVIKGEVKNGKHHVTLEAGKNYKFTIPSDELKEK